MTRFRRRHAVSSVARIALLFGLPASLPGNAWSASSRGVPGLDRLLSPAGWPYASAEPIGVGDPGRFHALFGRDAAIASLQLLPERPDVARATLRALASLQGAVEDPESDEEPGKIVHEWWPRAPERLCRGGWPVRDGALRYYGSADSTSWFLVLLASLGDRSLATELESIWRAASGWLQRALVRGEGLIRHGPRKAPGGLAQQGWRDAENAADPANHGAGILSIDGESPKPPLADADTQAVATVALRALALLCGDDRWDAEAARLSETIGEVFDPETVALDADGAKVPGAGSQLGWLLWAEALPPNARDPAAERLCCPDVLAPWGLHTLSSKHLQYAADAYHRGAIWPFDSWLGWGGLRAAGRLDAAEKLRLGVLRAIEAIGGAPELFAVEPDGPTPVPIANRIQAWTVGARWALENEWDGRASELFTARRS
jgi:glycogen debranching enzyme